MTDIEECYKENWDCEEYFCEFYSNVCEGFQGNYNAFIEAQISESNFLKNIFNHRTGGNFGYIKEKEVSQQ